ncbi:CzcE family metal-binding protein [Rugamonas sp.]|uniref:CzcE family metal-binding protein n=1 Tax=Rugamonas sp. TaxID=1926287 RepID=UPI0025E1435E|nr:CzcE family metal-binding protein [Rugamonas sp.]
MLNFKRARTILLTIGFSSALFAGAAQAAGPTAGSADFGNATNAAAERQIDLTAATRSVNVTDGETVRFNANGKSFTWHFDTYSNRGGFDLSKIAPADVMVGGVHVYVASNPIYRG